MNHLEINRCGYSSAAMGYAKIIHGLQYCNCEKTQFSEIYFNLIF